MAPVKVQNEMLLDLARSLRQERLLIGSERQNLQTLNLKVNIVDIFLFNHTTLLAIPCGMKATSHGHFL